MGVSFDKVDGAVWLNFETQPSANPTSEKDRTAKLVDPGFGRVFTDHMAIVRYNQAKGWHGARVESRANFPLDPATAVLHYGQSLFEGLKAFRGKDGKIRLFRPQKHVERLNRTAHRMTIPPLDPDLILRSWTTLVDVDRDWVPSSVGTSLYIRPTIIASERTFIQPSDSPRKAKPTTATRAVPTPDQIA